MNSTCGAESEAEYAIIRSQAATRREAWEKSGEKPRTWGQIRRENGK